MQHLQAVILVIHLIAAVSLIIVILIQPSEAGGFMGNTGAMSNLGAPRRTADVMTRATTMLAGLFFATSLLLAIVANNQPHKTSILDVDNGKKAEKTVTPAVPAAPADTANTTAPAEATNTTATNTTGGSANDNAAAPEKKPGKTDKKTKSAIPKAPVTQ